MLRWNGRVLVLAHVKELLEQNAEKIRRLCPEVPIGIYSAGLNRRETDKPVIVAGIHKADFGRLQVRGGEFVADEAENLMDDNRMAAAGVTV